MPRTIKEINAERVALVRQEEAFLKAHGIDASKGWHPEDRRKIRRNKNMAPSREIEEKILELGREIEQVRGR